MNIWNLLAEYIILKNENSSLFKLIILVVYQLRIQIIFRVWTFSNNIFKIISNITRNFKLLLYLNLIKQKYQNTVNNPVYIYWSCYLLYMYFFKWDSTPIIKWNHIHAGSQVIPYRLDLQLRQKNSASFTNTLMKFNSNRFSAFYLLIITNEILLSNIILSFIFFHQKIEVWMEIFKLLLHWWTLIKDTSKSCLNWMQVWIGIDR